MKSCLFSRYWCNGLPLVLLALLLNYSIQAQTVTADLPSLSPPSPTVAGLMKFEEVPVDHYSGIPDISIPLYSIETLSKDIKFDVSLKYHPYSIAVDEIASFVGLGWNLSAGGSISRTVNGYPDESNVFKQTGIYNNFYYEYKSLQGPQDKTEDDIEAMNNFCWDAFQKGELDTEHDLYQYNFMGHTGRFFVEKSLGGQLNAVKLDNDNTIDIHLNASGYTISSFDLYDDKGYQYVFEAKEITYDSFGKGSKGFGMLTGSPNPGTSYTFTSAYHLTKIVDPNGVELVRITYQLSEEHVNNKTTTNAFLSQLTPDKIRTWAKFGGNMTVDGMPPASSYVIHDNRIKTLKINEIEIVNKAKIKLNLAFDRDDTDINFSNGETPAARLQSITVKNIFGEKVKDYSFEHGYATMSNGLNHKSRLILTGVIDTEIVQEGQTGQQLVTSLDYTNVSAGRIRKDYWGFYSSRFDFSKEPDAANCMTHALKEMTLPTGGSIAFDFGPNTYSYIGNEPVTDFSIDDLEFPDFDSNVVIGDGTDLGLAPLDPTIDMDVTLYGVSSEPGTSFSIRDNKTREEYTFDCMGDSGAMNDGTCRGMDFHLKANMSYSIIFRRQGTSGTIKGDYKIVSRRKFDLPGYSFEENGPMWLNGGGIRINKISYFDGSTSYGTRIPVKEKFFDYNFFNNNLRSSGSLVFAKPVYYYKQGTTVMVHDWENGNDPCDFQTVYTDVSTSFNSLKGLRTHGSDVGYKNVKVWETGNGKSEYTYLTPIDYPESNIELVPPYFPSPNAEYKRGHLIKEKQYSESGNPESPTYRLISEKQYDYPMDSDIDEQLIATGLRLKANNLHPKASEAETWSGYKSLLNQSSGCNWPLTYLGPGDIWESFAWVKLKTKTLKEYFYPEGSSTANIVTTTETYGYDPYNKKMSWSTKTNSLGETLKTKYFYDYNHAGRNRIGVLKGTETWRDNKLLDKKDITFSNSNWGSANTSFLPKTIFVAKGNTTPEPKVQFLKYDQYGNPLEAKLENGKTVCYVWGYNSSYPIAIIENMEYDTLMNNPTWQSYVSSSITNTNNNNNINSLINLDDLRKGVPNDVSVTAFVYKPLVGVTAMIDPRGLKTTYSYDGFGRLLEVREKEFNGANAGEVGDLLSKNQYNIKSN